MSRGPRQRHAKVRVVAEAAAALPEPVAAPEQFGASRMVRRRVRRVGVEREEGEEEALLRADRAHEGLDGVQARKVVVAEEVVGGAAARLVSHHRRRGQCWPS